MTTAKKIVCLALVLAMACVSVFAQAAPEAAAKTSYKIGICQVVQHPALDAATQGFMDAVKEKLGDDVAFDLQNASGDSAMCSTMERTLGLCLAGF